MRDSGFFPASSRFGFNLVLIVNFIKKTLLCRLAFFGLPFSFFFFFLNFFYFSLRPIAAAGLTTRYDANTGKSLYSWSHGVIIHVAAPKGIGYCSNKDNQQHGTSSKYNAKINYFQAMLRIQDIILTQETRPHILPQVTPPQHHHHSHHHFHA